MMTISTLSIWNIRRFDANTKKNSWRKNVSFSDDSCVLKVYSSGIRFPAMSSSLCCTLEFTVHHLVDAFCKEIEILRKIKK